MKKLLFCLAFTLLISRPSFAQEAAPASEHAVEAEHEESSMAVVFRWVNFLILFGGLGYVLKKPAKEFFDNRRRDIAEGLNRAQAAQAAAQSRMDEIEQRLGKLSSDMSALRSQAEQESALDRDKIVAEAKAEVARVVEQSRQEIERVARGVERDIKENLADKVIDRAGQTLRTDMNEGDHKRVVVRFIKNL